MTKPQTPPNQQQVGGMPDQAARKAAEKSRAAQEQAHQGATGQQNDRAAHNQSGIGSHGGASDNTSGAHSGNQ